MLRPKKNSYKEFDKEKYSCDSKIPLPPPHNFSNGPSLSGTLPHKIVKSTKFVWPKGENTISFHSLFSC